MRAGGPKAHRQASAISGYRKPLDTLKGPAIEISNLLDCGIMYPYTIPHMRCIRHSVALRERASANALIRWGLGRRLKGTRPPQRIPSSGCSTALPRHNHQKKTSRRAAPLALLTLQLLCLKITKEFRFADDKACQRICYDGDRSRKLYSKYRGIEVL